MSVPGITRRNLVGALAAVASGRTTAKSAAGRPRIPDLAVATYSLRHFSRTMAIRMLRELGVQAACVKSYHLPSELSPLRRREAAREFAEAGIRLTGGGVVDLEAGERAALRAKLDYARDCGLPMLVISPAPGVLGQLDKLAGEYGIRLAVHNHGPEDPVFATPQSVLRALAGLDPRIGLCLDIGHSWRAGADIAEAISLAGPRLFDIHVKDLTDPGDANSNVPVGEGKIEYVPILKQLLAAGYQGSLHLEYETDEFAPISGMAKSLAYLRGILHSLSA